MRFLVAMSVSALCAVTAGAELQTKEVTYSTADTEMKGYLAWDDAAEGPVPAVLVVHEWWGHNDYARGRAEQLAKLGYAALAVDMYGEGKKADHPKEAGAFAAEATQNLHVAKARFEAAMDFLKKQPFVREDDLAAIGYCFGGGVVLNMARMGVDLDGVASFHGSLATNDPAEEGDVKASILVLHGAADSMIPEEQVEAFKQEMKEAGADLRFVAYPGAKHSFTNPDADRYAKEFSIDVGYDADADRKSWEELERFLERVFAD